jgi:hypothetical protein
MKSVEDTGELSTDCFLNIPSLFSREAGALHQLNARIQAAANEATDRFVMFSTQQKSDHHVRTNKGCAPVGPDGFVTRGGDRRDREHREMGMESGYGYGEKQSAFQ